MIEEQHVSKELFEQCIADLKKDLNREISSVKSAIIDAENTTSAGLLTLSRKVDETNGRVRESERWQLRHDGIEEGRAQVSTGIRNWIILGFGATATLQIIFGIVAYMVASN